MIRKILSGFLILALSVVIAQTVQAQNTAPSTRFHYGITGKAYSDEHLFVTLKNDCSQDVTAALETFATAHDGQVVFPPGCYLVNDYDLTSKDLIWVAQIPGTVTIKSDLGHYTVNYNLDTAAIDSSTTVSAITETTINRDDRLDCLSVASASGYSSGDYVRVLAPASPEWGIGGGTSSRIFTVTGATSANPIELTFANTPGITSTAFIYLRGFTGDWAALNGKLYNVTVTGSNTVTLQTYDGTTTGTNVDGSAYAAYSSNGGQAGQQNDWAGEGNRVANVDTVSSPNRVCLTHKLQYSEHYTQFPYVQLDRFTGTRKVQIEGLRFTANGNTHDPSQVGRVAVLNIVGVTDGIIRNNWFDATWGPAALIRSTPGLIYEHNSFRDLPNQGAYDSTTPTMVATSATNANPGVFTVAAIASGLSDNDTIYVDNCAGGTWSTLNDKQYRYTAISGTTFSLKDMNDVAIDTTSLGSMTSSSCTFSETTVDGLGYGINVGGAAFGVTIKDIDAFESRHLLTSAGAANSWATRSVVNGYPTFVTVKGVTCNDPQGSCIDTHEAGAAWDISDVTCLYAARNAHGASYPGICGQFRNKSATVRNFRQQGGVSGFRIYSTAHDATPEFRFDGFRVSDLRDGSDTEYALWLYDYDALTYKPIVWVNNAYISNVGEPFGVGKSADLRIRNAYIRDFDSAFDVQCGATVDVSNLETDFRGQTRTGSSHHTFLMRSAAACSPTVMVRGYHNTQGSGTNGSLAVIFNQMDSTATKYIWLDDYTSYNPNAVTEATVVSNSASTFSMVSTITKRASLNAFARNVNTTAVGNVGTGEDNLITYSLPQGALLGAGKGVRITAYGTTANNANAKTLKCYFGSQLILTTSLQTGVAGTWRYSGQVISTGTDTQDWQSTLAESATTSVNDTEVGTATQDDGAAVTIKCTGEATSNNDITMESLVVEGL